ncbi:MAG: MmgE/PrpD family protein, partial [Gammaproteobacteria bacterium]|nr:MmgE/PrpD family protein [Gammaproteobacteria bacterium]
MDSIEIICAHVLDTEHADLSDEAVRWSRIFLLDSLGVGVSGSSGPWVDALARSQASAHLAERTAGARVLGSDQRLSAQGAALLNAYQIHNAEYDCVHEGAVVHPMAVLLGATLAAIDDGALFAQPVDGRSLLSAVALGVDVAATLGLAARSGLRFFRPATAGAFAATAAIGRLAGFDRPTLVSAMGISLSQLCGTMQAHSEGSPLLAMQVGFNARNAVLACELARAGVPGPGAVLDGPYAYFELFEAEHDYADLLQQLGHCWRITEVAHKPFPSGRATHGIVDACLEIGAHHDLRSVAIERVVARVPPLTRRLVGRPVKPDMAVNYARLCAQYVVARVLQRGELDLSDFSIEALRDEATLALAQR